MKEVVIVGAARTAVGSFQGSLSGVKVTKLGSIVISEALKRAGVEPDQVDEVLMGCVLPAGLGQAPARQAAIDAGIPVKVCATTINKICGSGMKTVMLADAMIKAGDADIIVAGGMESMTGAPYLLPDARMGFRMGPKTAVDSMVFDGLWNIYSDEHMGSCADMLARDWKISREDQDAFALNSYRKAQEATKSGVFKPEIVAVEIPQRKGDPIIFDEDEEPKRLKKDKVPALRPAFNKDGTVTAANASSINDGAAAVVVMSAEKAKELGVKPLVKIVGHAQAAREPEWFTLAPIDATKKVLEKTGLKIGQMDLIELNEAFGVQVLAAERELGFDMSKVNVNGGAVAIGHPIGCSGARILVTLLYAMKERKAKLGLATLCLGGGGAVAMIVSR